MNDTLNNQLAQVCNNLFCILREIKKYKAKLPFDYILWNARGELETEYNTLFKLIYGDK